MPTQTLSLKARISAIITALVLFITALCCMARPTFASADRWNEDEFDIDYTHVCTDDCYRNIFYLTDNPSAEYYVDTFLRSMVNMYAQQHIVFNEFRYYDLAAMGGTSWRLGTLDQWRFGYPPIELQFYPIHDALVIYEINNKMPFQFTDRMSYQPTAELYDYFSMLKSYNCKIMFICNTDEVHFNDQDESNRFLDLVDVHINTDIYSFFTETFLTFFTQNGISNSTIILDRSMAQLALFGDSIYCEYKENYYKRIYDEYAVKYNVPDHKKYGSRYGFLDGTLFPHVRKELEAPKTGWRYPDNVSLMKGKAIKILCYLGEQIFYDFANETIYYWAIYDEEFLTKYENDYYYLVCSTSYCDDSYMSDLLDMLINMEEYTNIMFDKYMFVEYGSYYYRDGIENMHAAGMDNSNMASFIAPIVADFLFDDIYYVNWAAMDNWEGRCEVTIKPTSDDSWLLPLSDPDDTINGDDAERYYG